MDCEEITLEIPAKFIFFDLIVKKIEKKSPVTLLLILTQFILIDVAKTIVLLMIEGPEFLNIENMDFSGLNLANVNFSKAFINESDFSHSKMNGANFTKTNIVKSNFNNSKLVFARLANCFILESGFCNVNMELTSFNDAKVNNSDMTNSKLNNADCSYSNFYKTNLSGVEFNINTILRKTSFDNTYGENFGNLKISCSWTIKKEYGSKIPTFVY